MENINNIDIYNQRMAAGMADKLWWLRKIGDGIKVVVDYGCADGTLLSLVHHDRPDLILIGIDNNPKMLDLARENVPNAIFCSPEAFKEFRFDLSNAILIMSSVIHEIFAYDQDPIDTLTNLFEYKFGYIAIRDMFVSNHKPVEQVTKVESDAIRSIADPNQIKDFEAHYGWVDDNRQNLMHFLLKYKYVENWKREVAENYFPITVERLLSRYVPIGYTIEHMDHYLLPFIHDQIKKDFGLDLDDKTHLKLLLKKA